MWKTQGLKKIIALSELSYSTKREDLALGHTPLELQSLDSNLDLSIPKFILTM